MRNVGYVLFALGLALLSAGCNSTKAPEQQPGKPRPGRNFRAAHLRDQRSWRRSDRDRLR